MIIDFYTVSKPMLFVNQYKTVRNMWKHNKWKDVDHLSYYYFIVKTVSRLTK